jgi:hypothetical protein
MSVDSPRNSSVIQEENDTLSKLTDLFVAEKQKTVLAMIRIANLNIFVGIILLISLTINCTFFLWHQNVPSIMTGYALCLLMIGVGIALLSVNTSRRLGEDNNLQKYFISFGTLSWSNQSEIEDKTSKSQCWLIFFGSTLMIFALLIGSAEATILSLDIEMFGGFNDGKFIGLSVLFFISGSVCHFVVRKPSRKMLYLLLIFGLISFIGSIVLTVVSLKFYAIENFFDYDGFWNYADKFDLYFAKNVDGNYYFPLWPYHYLLTVMCTPVSTVVALSKALTILCLHILITYKNKRNSDKTKDLTESSAEDIGLKLTGFLLVLLGFGFLISTFQQVNLTFASMWYSMKIDCLIVNFIFTFAGLFCMLCKPKYTIHRFTLLLMAATVFAVSTYMVVNQTKFFHEAQREHRLTLMDSNETEQFCLWTFENCDSTNIFYHHKDELCGPERNLVCISQAKKCDGIIDMFSNGNGSYSFFESKTKAYYPSPSRRIRGAPDETYCGVSRFLGFYIFNFCVGALGILLSTVIGFRTFGSVRDVARFCC